MLPYVSSACVHPCFFLDCIISIINIVRIRSRRQTAFWLSENDLKKSPVRFLVSGWEFYPDALLTPEEIQDSDHYMRYLSIGEMSNFSSPADSSPYGCGTYRMTFFLPERKEAYAIELPEVFSSYTLYLDHDRILQLGDPEQSAAGAKACCSQYRIQVLPHHLH